MPLRFASIEAAHQWMADHGKGRAWHLVVLHHDACMHGRETACTCTPEFVVEDLTPETFQRGEQEQQSWLDRHRWN